MGWRVLLLDLKRGEGDSNCDHNAHQRDEDREDAL